MDKKLLNYTNMREVPLKIGFLTTLNVNIGDEFIRQGIRHCLNRVGVPWIPFFVNKHDASSLVEPRDGEVDRIGNKLLEVDVFIQSGSPLYWHHGEHGHRSTKAEWHEWVWEKGLLSSVEEPELLNLGAGSCQPWADTGASFVSDPECASFAQRAAARSRLTTVRDSVASNILTQLGVSHHCLPCPAFLAAASLTTQSRAGSLIGINVMPKGGHYEFKTSISTLAWVRRLHDMLQRLRKEGHLLFICHSMEEKLFAEMFAEGGEQVFYSSSFRDYLEMFRMLSCIFSNRVHAAVTAAGFGVPGVIAGTDTRVQIGEWIGLDALHSPEMSSAEAAGMVADLLRKRHEHRERLLGLREKVEAKYLEILAPILNSTYPRYVSPRSNAALHPIVKWAGSSRDSASWSARLGIEPQWPIEEVGFHGPEMWQGKPLRWTNGQAMLRIPDELPLICSGVEIVFWNLYPPGHRFLVRINGVFVVEEKEDAACLWTVQVVFSPQLLRSIEIVSDTLSTDGDLRTLGMAVRHIRPLNVVSAESGVTSTDECS